MKRNWHYYEAHINLGEMTKEQELALFHLLQEIDFKTTDIVNTTYEGLEQEEFHTILTTKDSNLNNLMKRIEDSCELLINVGYKVNRYKIESTVIDSKFEDHFGLLT